MATFWVILSGFYCALSPLRFLAGDTIWGSVDLFFGLFFGWRAYRRVQYQRWRV
jgi:hypothetical protein